MTDDELMPWGDPETLLGEAVDDVMSPMIDRVWGPLLPHAWAARIAGLSVTEPGQPTLEPGQPTLEPGQPTLEEIVERLRDNGLKGPDSREER